MYDNEELSPHIRLVNRRGDLYSLGRRRKKHRARAAYARSRLDIITCATG